MRISANQGSAAQRRHGKGRRKGRSTMRADTDASIAAATSSLVETTGTPQDSAVRSRYGVKQLSGPALGGRSPDYAEVTFGDFIGEPAPRIQPAFHSTAYQLLAKPTAAAVAPDPTMMRAGESVKLNPGTALPVGRLNEERKQLPDGQWQLQVAAVGSDPAAVAASRKPGFLDATPIIKFSVDTQPPRVTLQKRGEHDYQLKHSGGETPRYYFVPASQPVMSAEELLQYDAHRSLDSFRREQADGEYVIYAVDHAGNARLVLAEGKVALLLLKEGVQSVQQVLPSEAPELAHLQAWMGDGPPPPSAPITATIRVALQNDTGPSDTDRHTSDGTLRVSGLHADRPFQYRFRHDSTWREGKDGLIPHEGQREGERAVIVKQRMDDNGVAVSPWFQYRLGAELPANLVKEVPAEGGPLKLTLRRDTGIEPHHETDGITKDGTVLIRGLPRGAASWEFRVNDGSWTPGHAPGAKIDASTVKLPLHQFNHKGALSVTVRALSADGQTLAEAEKPLSFTLDREAPAERPLVGLGETPADRTDRLSRYVNAQGQPVNSEERPDGFLATNAESIAVPGWRDAQALGEDEAHYYVLRRVQPDGTLEPVDVLPTLNRDARIPIADLEDGAYRLIVDFVDIAGNRTSGPGGWLAVEQFYKDTEAPSAPQVLAPSHAHTHLEVRGLEPKAAVEVAVNGGQPERVHDLHVKLGHLLPGDVISTYQIDLAGNKSEARYFKVATLTDQHGQPLGAMPYTLSLTDLPAVAVSPTGVLMV